MIESLKTKVQKILHDYAKWNFDVADGIETPSTQQAAFIERDFIERILNLLKEESS